jgi:hypothetical protein
MPKVATPVQFILHVEPWEYSYRHLTVKVFTSDVLLSWYHDTALEMYWQQNAGESTWYGFHCESRWTTMVVANDLSRLAKRIDRAATRELNAAHKADRWYRADSAFDWEFTPNLLARALKRLKATQVVRDPRTDKYVPIADVLGPEYYRYGAYMDNVQGLVADAITTTTVEAIPLLHDQMQHLIDQYGLSCEFTQAQLDQWDEYPVARIIREAPEVHPLAEFLDPTQEPDYVEPVTEEIAASAE